MGSTRVGFVGAGRMGFPMVERLAAAGPLAAALPDGAVFASHVTGRASVLRSLADRFPAIHVVDAPVSGGPSSDRAAAAHDADGLLDDRPGCQSVTRCATRSRS